MLVLQLQSEISVSFQVICINNDNNYIFCLVKCIHPHNLPMIDDSLIIYLDFDPPVMDTNATFSCLSGLVLRGPYMSTCMENGEWEPDPREVECLGKTLLYLPGYKRRRGYVNSSSVL